jgi:2-polyprenyl-3-methyl-5-hydroxy-6-metoxy-1,4-benzoquinol methylase
MFKQLETINHRPRPFEFYTAQELWASEHTSKKMLEYHLNDEIEASSRSTKFIDNSVSWIQKHFDIVAGSRVADFGCAVGHYSNRLARLGAELTGIDFSPRSIEYAKAQAEEQNLEVNYLCQNNEGVF